MFILVLLLLLPAVILFILLIQPRLFVKLVARLNPGVLYFVPSSGKQIALTIDDGPHPVVTPAILDVLKESGCHATFFLLGDHAHKTQALVRRIKSEGHEVGNHLMTDRPSIFLGERKFESELIECEKIIHPREDDKWFRPGSGWFTHGMLKTAKRHGYKVALGSVFPHDTLIRYIPYISEFILRKVFPGSIVILHDGSADRIRTVKVLKRILPVLMRRGYKVMALSELVAASNDVGNFYGQA
ncbi:MAG: chitin deacetylase family protein [Pyrinomonadaceae bacterium]